MISLLDELFDEWFDCVFDEWFDLVFSYKYNAAGKSQVLAAALARAATQKSSA